ncbi:MAG TPA: hypothetical protein VGH27_09470 [Streptosporangiaceae bacterium]|jgi:hypothetical protein
MHQRHVGGLAVAVAGLAGLTSACGASGGSPIASATTAKPATYQQWVAYAQCIRSHGAPEFPDPVQDQFGGWVFLSTPGSGVTGPGVPVAENACKALEPPQNGLTPQEQQEALAQALKHTNCMRAHGITNFPDPVAEDQGGQLGISINPSGLDMNSPQFQAAQTACQQYQPGPRKGPSQ